MKTQRLAFNQLHDELEVLGRESLRGIKGGLVSPHSNGTFTQWISQELGMAAISGTDEEGNWMISVDGGSSWMRLVFELDSVEIVGQRNLSRPTIFSSVYYGLNVGWADNYGVTYGITNTGSGGSSSGGGTGNNSGSIFGSSQTHLLTTLSETHRTELLDQIKMTMFNGIVNGDTSSTITFNTTYVDGQASSFDITIGGVTVSLLTSWGVSVGVPGPNNVTLTSGISTDGFLASYQIADSTGWIGGMDVSARPGGYALMIVLAFIYVPGLLPALGEGLPAWVVAF